MFIDDGERYMKLGLATKKVFTDAEYEALPNISNLYKLYTEYEELLNQKQAAETTLANAEAHNADLPDNSTEMAEIDGQITTKQGLITDIDAAYDAASILDKLTLSSAKANYEQEIEQLESQKAELEQGELTIDTVPLQTEVDNLTAAVNAKITEVNDECTALGIEAIING